VRGKSIRKIYPITEEIIQDIEEKDIACIALGVDFVKTIMSLRCKDTQIEGDTFPLSV
jgi:hypothetical protein